MKIEIDPRSAGLGALVVLLTAGAASPMVMRSDGLRFPDGTVQTTAATGDTRRSWYLTESQSDGAAAPFACAPGYHMASLWEVLDPTELRYASEEPDAREHADMGSGPPQSIPGWIRTGHQSRSTQEDDNSTGDGGYVNCSAYNSNAANEDGTFVMLNRCWQEEEDCNIGSGSEVLGKEVAPWWLASESTCDSLIRVWCVED
ncbi:MAG: hypothetical protein ACOC7L_03525 [Acidobacteriota bacterium]